MFDNAGTCINIICSGQLIEIEEAIRCDLCNQLISLDSTECLDSCPAGQVDINDKCTCDSSKNFVAKEDLSGCQCSASHPIVSKDGSECLSGCSGLGLVSDGGSSPQCICDNASHFVSAFSASCQCDSENGWYLNIAGTACVQSCGAKAAASGALCVCDDQKHYVLKDGNCACSASYPLSSLDSTACLASCQAGQVNISD